MLFHYKGDAACRDKAIDLVQRSVPRAPERPDFHNNLGCLLRERGQLVYAVAAFRRAIELRPDYSEAWNNIGAAHQDRDELTRAIDCYRRALQLRPEYPEALSNLAGALESAGRAAEALEVRRRLVALRPTDAAAHADLLICLHYTHGDDGGRMLDEHLVWSEHHAGLLYPLACPHVNDRSPVRRLRVGYLSADFRSHPVARFIQPALFTTTVRRSR